MANSSGGHQSSITDKTIAAFFGVTGGIAAAAQLYDYFKSGNIEALQVGIAFVGCVLSIGAALYLYLRNRYADTGYPGRSWVKSFKVAIVPAVVLTIAIIFALFIVDKIKDGGMQVSSGGAPSATMTVRPTVHQELPSEDGSSGAQADRLGSQFNRAGDSALANTEIEAKGATVPGRPDQAPISGDFRNVPEVVATKFPGGRINSPPDGGRIDPTVIVEGSAVLAEQGHQVWLLVEVPAVNRFYPGHAALAVASNSSWTSNITVGGPGDVSGTPYAIHLVELDDRAIQRFRVYLEDERNRAGTNEEGPVGFERSVLDELGIKFLHSVSVMRR